MKIYFSGSIRGAEPRKTWFQALIKHLGKYGAVLTENSFNYSYEEEIKFDDRWIWERDIIWLNEADVLVAEVTSPSLGVGYEIGKAEEWGKPILCLYQYNEKKLSAMIGGSKHLKVVEYKEDHQAMQAIDEFLSVFT
jgi:nucleoside 2-deoxyribosyltransferase